MGIKGVGMATLAIIAKQAGFVVGGSDVPEEFITDKILRQEGIEIREGFFEENIREFIGSLDPGNILLIATGAHQGFSNTEVEFARSLGIKVVSHGEAVGMFMKGEILGREFDGISVAGAHGKTTIAGMLASSLTKLGQDPSYSVGTSEIFPIGPAGHFGLGKHFIAEADEYVSEAKFDRNPKFLYQNPNFLIVNNIDFDHPDFYKDIEDVKQAYFRFISSLDSGATLIMNGDDENILEIVQKLETSPKKITYGTGEKNDFRISRYAQEGFTSYFTVHTGGTNLGSFNLSIPGYHNAKNALSVIAILIELGFAIPNIQKVLPEFKGVKRRFEWVGQSREGVTVFDDYAHHPEEIRKTLETLRAAVGKNKITAIFQAHTFSRTKALLPQFASSFIACDELILLPTFASLRDEVKDAEQDMLLLEEIRKLKANVKLISGANDVVEYIRKNLDSNSVVITLGAGDVYKVALQLTDNL